MIGNDIVDLVRSRKDSNWRRRGFINKIFSENEQLLIANSDDQEIVVWLLWSMKEAAYKIWNRETGSRKYAPIRLLCSFVERSCGTAVGEVVCEENRYYTKTIVGADFIHTIAVKVFDHLDHVVELKRCQVVKDPLGLPGIAMKGRRELLPVSISNHGRFEKIVAVL
ncbi:MULTISPECIES: 4'-phosphopantetheinyl transferase family protein [unclassified Sphingobacterium]|uniref:4'-phosphopantetheinyl transferase family protein n=1 Tax=unclassified Sphingobacterium TaxID=2609468 RepID=UPI0025F201B0|nr:4'-phosphopantetheinyl transferase superfamily protein [Sphingobacterium sp. UBA5670]